MTGVEHNEEGKPSEAANNRQAQMDKRMKKTEQLLIEAPVEGQVEEEVDVLFIGFISTKGAIEEGVQRIKDAGHTAAHMQIRQLHPFPTETVQNAVNKAQKVIVVEHNYQGQLANIIKMNVQLGDKLIKQTKYDGTPFLPKEIETKGLEIVNQLKERV